QAALVSPQQQQQQQSNSQNNQPAVSACANLQIVRKQQPGSGDMRNQAAEGRQFCLRLGKNSAKQAQSVGRRRPASCLGGPNCRPGLDAATGAVLGRGCDLKTG
uniref:Protein Smaug n=1 Tax=Macrostomum lignano TaxID=282301 RepID=A0A1I8F631_9PLAT